MTCLIHSTDISHALDLLKLGIIFLTTGNLDIDANSEGLTYWAPSIMHFNAAQFKNIKQSTLMDRNSWFCVFLLCFFFLVVTGIHYTDNCTQIIYILQYSALNVNQRNSFSFFCFNFSNHLKLGVYLRNNQIATLNQNHLELYFVAVSPDTNSILLLVQII